MMFSYLKELKEQAGNPTNAYIAEKSGVPESTIAKMMSGNVDNPRFQSVVDVVIALGGSLDALVGIVKEQPGSIKIDNPIEAIEKVIKVEESAACSLADEERQEYNDRIQRIMDEASAREERIREEARLHESEMRKEYIERETKLHTEFAERIKRSHHREGALFAVVCALVAFIMTVLLIDLLNPSIGYFRYLATTIPEVSNMIDSIFT